jgi:hypothetical protein
LDYFVPLRSVVSSFVTPFVVVCSVCFIFTFVVCYVVDYVCSFVTLLLLGVVCYVVVFVVRCCCCVVTLYVVRCCCFFDYSVVHRCITLFVVVLFDCLPFYWICFGSFVRSYLPGWIPGLVVPVHFVDNVGYSRCCSTFTLVARYGLLFTYLFVCYVCYVVHDLPYVRLLVYVWFYRLFVCGYVLFVVRSVSFFSYCSLLVLVYVCAFSVVVRVVALLRFVVVVVRCLVYVTSFRCHVYVVGLFSLYVPFVCLILRFGFRCSLHTVTAVVCSFAFTFGRSFGSLTPRSFVHGFYVGFVRLALFAFTFAVRWFVRSPSSLLRLVIRLLFVTFVRCSFTLFCSAPFTLRSTVSVLLHVRLVIRFYYVCLPFVAFYVCLFDSVSFSLRVRCSGFQFVLVYVVALRSWTFVSLLRSTLFYVPRYVCVPRLLCLFLVPFVAVLVFAFCVTFVYCGCSFVVRYVTFRYVATFAFVVRLFRLLRSLVDLLFVVAFVTAFVFTLFSLFVLFHVPRFVRWVVTFVYVVAGSRLLPRLRLPLRVCSTFLVVTFRLLFVCVHVFVYVPRCVRSLLVGYVRSVRFTRLVVLTVSFVCIFVRLRTFVYVYVCVARCSFVRCCSLRVRFSLRSTFTFAFGCSLRFDVCYALFVPVGYALFVTLFLLLVTLFVRLFVQFALFHVRLGLVTTVTFPFRLFHVRSLRLLVLPTFTLPLFCSVGLLVVRFVYVRSLIVLTLVDFRTLVVSLLFAFVFRVPLYVLRSVDFAVLRSTTLRSLRLRLRYLFHTTFVARLLPLFTFTLRVVRVVLVTFFVGLRSRSFVCSLLRFGVHVSFVYVCCLFAFSFVVTVRLLRSRSFVALWLLPLLVVARCLLLRCCSLFVVGCSLRLIRCSVCCWFALYVRCYVPRLLLPLRLLFVVRLVLVGCFSRSVVTVHVCTFTFTYVPRSFDLLRVVSVVRLFSLFVRLFVAV